MVEAVGAGQRRPSGTFARHEAVPPPCLLSREGHMMAVVSVQQERQNKAGWIVSHWA